MDIKTGIATPAPTKPYDIMTLDLGQIVWVFCEHNFNFEQLRLMTLQELANTLDDINAGKYKMIHELRAEAEEAKRNGKGKKK